MSEWRRRDCEQKDEILSEMQASYKTCRGSQSGVKSGSTRIRYRQRRRIKNNAISMHSGTDGRFRAILKMILAFFTLLMKQVGSVRFYTVVLETGEAF